LTRGLPPFNGEVFHEMNTHFTECSLDLGGQHERVGELKRQ
jgi:hypothetical protein